MTDGQFLERFCQRIRDYQFLLASEWLQVEYRWLKSEAARKRPYQSLHHARVRSALWNIRLAYFGYPLCFVVGGPVMWLLSGIFDGAHNAAPWWLYGVFVLPIVIPAVPYVWFEFLGRSEPELPYWPESALTAREREFRRKIERLEKKYNRAVVVAVLISVAARFVL